MKSNIFFLIVLLLIISCRNESRQTRQQWCLTQANSASDELKNVETVYAKRQYRPDNFLLPVQIKKITHSDRPYLEKILDIKHLLGRQGNNDEHFKQLSKIWQGIERKNKQANLRLFRKNKLEKTYRNFVKTDEMPSFYSNLSKYENETDIQSLLMDFERNNREAIRTLDFEIRKVYNFLTFPLRVGIVVDSTNTGFSAEAVYNTIDILNSAFAEVFISFDLVRIDTIHAALKMEDLGDNFYDPYRIFSQKNDLVDTISVFVFSQRNKLCEVNGNAVFCSKKSGFSYVLSEETNNIVLNIADLEDDKIIVHEFGHFFGLYHTFEENAFGKEPIDGTDCANTGDRICDTPADPGNAFEVYVNYSKCEMMGNFDAASGLEYKPLINNYMSYYHPCYLKSYSFTPEQLNIIFTASRSPVRLKFTTTVPVM